MAIKIAHVSTVTALHIINVINCTQTYILLRKVPVLHRTVPTFLY